MKQKKERRKKERVPIVAHANRFIITKGWYCRCVRRAIGAKKPTTKTAMMLEKNF